MNRGHVTERWTRGKRENNRGEARSRTQLLPPPWPRANSREEPCSTAHEELHLFLGTRRTRQHRPSAGTPTHNLAHLTRFPWSVVLVTFRTPHFSEG